MTKEPQLDIPALVKRPKESSSQFIYRRLRHAVMIGRVSPGRAVTIREVATTLGTSVMPVREALRHLAAERALEVKDNRRVQVPNMTPPKFAELCELRVLLETYAAVRAMPFITAEHLETLAELDRGIDAANAAVDYELAIQLNHEFHRTIYAAYPYSEAMPLIESVWLQLGPFVRLALANLKNFYLIDRHAEAMSALRRRDEIALRIAIAADIRDGIAHVGTSEFLGAYTEKRAKSLPAAIDAPSRPRKGRRPLPEGL